MRNRTIPTDILIPHVHYGDVIQAIDWLTATFGFREHFRYGEPVSGAQMCLGDAWIMLKRRPEDNLSPKQLGYGTQNLTVFVEDVDAHFAQTKSAGAKIVEELHETVYGERQYVVEDLDGHLWFFSKHSRDLSPGDWGASVRHTSVILG